jgi:recombination protein RecA
MVQTTGKVQALRLSIEARMEDRFPGALTFRTRLDKPRLCFGITALDTLTGGGVPLGAITELAGTGSCGRTTAAMQLASSAMCDGRVCAWVDAADGFDPISGVANGVHLASLLWVRCYAVEPSQSSSNVTLTREGRSEEQHDSSIFQGRHPVENEALPGRCGSHPRGEAQGLDRAVGGLFQARARQKTGTPGTPNLPITAPPHQASPRQQRFHVVRRQEQPGSDRLGGRKIAVRRAAALPDELGPQSRILATASNYPQVATKPAQIRTAKPWTRLDQALRATDLLLQGGGFSLVVLDLAGIPPEAALRIPAATWFRFRAMAEASGTALVLLTETACARSSAALVLACRPMQVSLAGGTVLETMRYQVEAARQRLQPEPSLHNASGGERKPPKATWQGSPYCMPKANENSSLVVTRSTQSTRISNTWPRR